MNVVPSPNTSLTRPLCSCACRISRTLTKKNTPSARSSPIKTAGSGTGDRGPAALPVFNAHRQGGMPAGRYRPLKRSSPLSATVCAPYTPSTWRRAASLNRLSPDTLLTVISRSQTGPSLSNRVCSTPGVCPAGITCVCGDKPLPCRSPYSPAYSARSPGHGAAHPPPASGR